MFTWELGFVQAIQSISETVRNGSMGLLDVLMLLITQMGSEVFFIVAGVAVFWCVNKKFGYKLIFVFLLGMLINFAIKSIVKIDRPYTFDSVVSIGPETSGYSFPSGHAQGAALLATQLALYFGGRKRKWIYFLAGACVLAVCFSRVYLGQHYVSDVLTGAVLGVVLSVAIGYLFDRMGNREEWWPLILLPAVPLTMIFASSHLEVFMADGAYLAIVFGYILDKHFIKYEVKASPGFQLIKLLAGGGLLVGVLFGLKAVFALVGDYYILEAATFFIVCGGAIAGLPILFKLLLKKVEKFRHKTMRGSIDCLESKPEMQ